MMAKRLLGLTLFIFVFPCFLGKFSTDLNADQAVYYHAITCTVKVQYYVEYETIYGTREDLNTSGSGVLIGADKILTCYHIMSSVPVGKIRIFLFFGDHTEVRDNVTILKFDAYKDLALLQVDQPFNVPGSALASDLPAIGEDIIIVGHSVLPVTRLRLGKFLMGPDGIMVQPIYRGDSGGGIFNTRGELIGIIQFGIIIKEPTDQTTLIGYAIPLPVLREFLS